MKKSERKERLRRFYRNLCLSFVRGLRTLSLYPPEHPETEKNVGDFFQRLDKYLLQRSSLSFIFMRGEVAVENIRLPELSTGLGQVIKRLQAMDLQRLIFRRGLTKPELLLFLQLLLPLLKKSQEAELVLAKNQERFPHILAGRLPFDETLQTSHEDLSSTLRIARETVLSFSSQLKDLFADLHEPLSEAKVATAKETAENIYNMVMAGEFLLKMVISRRSHDPDPHTHAINVSTLSMALAQELGVENALIKEIGLGALLHDIGLYLSPSTSLSETVVVTLDEKKRRWEHPIRGAEILLASPGVPDLVPIVAFEHHLHYDGGGYPRQER
ncbi:MAG: HDIG domain-containing protein, partial [Proteobacteria bacterium]|nr:HDIG domain-containing protein [Pseudomonadota bacterium]